MFFQISDGKIVVLTKEEILESWSQKNEECPVEDPMQWDQRVVMMCYGLLITRLIKFEDRSFYVQKSIGDWISVISRRESKYAFEPEEVEMVKEFAKRNREAVREAAEKARSLIEGNG